LRKLICRGRISRAQTCRRQKLYAAVALAATLISSVALAEQNGARVAERSGDEPGGVRALASDVKGYVTAPLHAERRQWVRFGAVLAGVAFAYGLDDEVREHFGTATVPVGVSADTRDARDAAPAALALGGTWLAGVLADEDDGRREAGAMLEAAALSGAAAYALKELAGRERPYVTADKNAWDGEGEAFPSLHTTAAFAIGTVLAESGNDRHRWVRRALGYGLAVGTAYARMDHDAHWLSDTVAGAGLGVATARFVMKRRDAREQRARFGLVPIADGVAIGYTVDLRR
jgi:membrane-associated phospholipid phosphatase